MKILFFFPNFSTKLLKVLKASGTKVLPRAKVNTCIFDHTKTQRSDLRKVSEFAPSELAARKGS